MRVTVEIQGPKVRAWLTARELGARSTTVSSSGLPTALLGGQPLGLVNSWGDCAELVLLKGVYPPLDHAIADCELGAVADAAVEVVRRAVDFDLGELVGIRVDIQIRPDA